MYELESKGSLNGEKGEYQADCPGGNGHGNLERTLSSSSVGSSVRGTDKLYGIAGCGRGVPRNLLVWLISIGTVARGGDWDGGVGSVVREN